MAKNKDFKVTRREFARTTATVAVVGAAAGGAVAALKPTKAKAQAMSTVRWGFLIDGRMCVGCESCSVACKTQSEVPLGVFRNSVKFLETGTYAGGDAQRHFLPWLCNHCESPSCIEDCPVPEVNASLAMPDGTTIEFCKKATYKRPDGVVRVDQDRCVGCGNCVTACPYGARFSHPSRAVVNDFDPVDPPRGDTVTDKCDLCVNRIERGAQPACIQTCPHGARMVGNLLDPSSGISMAITAAGSAAQRIHAEGATIDHETDPQVYYIAPDAGFDVDRVFDEGSDTKDRVTS